jgi:2-keto-4-pentenoate hydratase/2-oxohepta-3-ene-1,7-dioic acid hydratase in catechol pathway
VRFHPRSNPSRIFVGQPVDPNIDVGLAVSKNEDVPVTLYSGTSVLAAGEPTPTTEIIGKLLSPLSQEEVGTIRCIGLNYVQHANEVKMAIPDSPTLFLKPETSLADPSAPYKIPKASAGFDTTDFESELCIVIGKTAKDVSEADALQYVLGYTAANDLSARAEQFAQSQWCFSKGYDGACPIGPVLVSAQDFPADKFRVRGLKNGKVLQECGTDDLIFSVEKIVSFLSQGTTLRAGTIILTGTPAGVGHSFTPKEYLRAGDEFTVEIQPGIGSLVTKLVKDE